ncbi:uncharacterized protein [Narcine bancroftii]|uniref:uncharacterized protein isoform X3 n=1 Tax=Narcine bancroftii TaxID=1343680 RepID=UPI00383174B2
MAEDAELSKFEQEALDAHNEYRRLHTTPPLTYNMDMVSACQEWADILAPRGEMEHSETKNGENIWYKWSSGAMEFTGKDPVDAWYEEIKDYDYSNPGFSSETGHFTQLLWKGTKEMAIAYSVSGQTAIAVAHYSPAGNITNEGYFERNVLPLAAPPEATAEPAAGIVSPEAEPESGSPAAEPEGETLAELQPSEPTPAESAVGPASEVEVEPDTAPETQEPTPVVSPPPEAAAEAKKESVPAAEPQSADNEMSKFESEVLEAHNHYRTMHEAPALQYSFVLRAECKKWAEYLASTGVIEESRTKNGENIWTTPSTDKEVSGKDPVIAWYNEINDYDFNSPGFSTLTSQFTQMIWVETKEMGIAYASGDKGTFVVAQYSPAGNIIDQHSFQTNVRPKDSLSMDSKEIQDQISQQYSETTELTPFEKTALEAHNQYRARHNTTPLTFSQELSKDCSVWANVLTQDGVIAQSPTNFGENIWSNPNITTGEITGKEAVDTWYSEIQYYDFENPGPSEKTEHFTQMIWQETTDMGIAYVVSDKGAFVVAQYKTRGNTPDPKSFAKNVLPLNASFSKPTAEPEPPTETKQEPPEAPAGVASPPAEELTAQEKIAEEPETQEKTAEEPEAQEKTAEEPEAQEKTAEEPEAQEKAAEEPKGQEKPAGELTAQEKPAEKKSAENQSTESPEPAPPKEEKRKAHRHCPKKKDPKLKKAERSPCE